MQKTQSEGRQPTARCGHYRGGNGAPAAAVMGRHRHRLALRFVHRTPSTLRRRVCRRRTRARVLSFFLGLDRATQGARWFGACLDD
eukprot:6990424-Prymnesium_polylepis.1